MADIPEQIWIHGPVQDPYRIRVEEPQGSIQRPEYYVGYTRTDLFKSLQAENQGLKKRIDEIGSGANEGYKMRLAAESKNQAQAERIAELRSLADTAIEHRDTYQSERDYARERIAELTEENDARKRYIASKHVDACICANCEFAAQQEAPTTRTKGD